jgi:threonine/homoserine/homoserine lactone efflux protein
VLSIAWLLVLTAALDRLPGRLQRRAVNRSLDIGTAVVLLGFSARVAVERA